MIVDDQETEAREAEEQARIKAEEEAAKAQAEADAEAEAEKDPLEVEFNEEEANYQENTFFKHNMPMPGNRDIMEAVGLEYKHVSYEPKPK